MRATTLLLIAACSLSATPALAHGPGGRDRWGPYSVELVDEAGALLATYQERGRTYVLGRVGRRYGIRVRNGSARRVEVVVSVDGRDVIDGRPASFGRRGYVVDAHGELQVDGYRLSDARVAAFRFGTVARSYAARMGDARDVGVIGVAVFPEREPRFRPSPLSKPAPPSADERGEGSSSPEPQASAPGEARGEGLGGRSSRAAPRPGLGTEFGEERESRVVEVEFLRARAAPDAVLAIRYDDRAGLLALGIDVDPPRADRTDDRWLRETADPFRRAAGFSEPPPGWRP